MFICFFLKWVPSSDSIILGCHVATRLVFQGPKWCFGQWYESQVVHVVFTSTSVNKWVCLCMFVVVKCSQPVKPPHIDISAIILHAIETLPTWLDWRSSPPLEHNVASLLRSLDLPWTHWAMNKHWCVIKSALVTRLKQHYVSWLRRKLALSQQNLAKQCFDMSYSIFLMPSNSNSVQAKNTKRQMLKLFPWRINSGTVFKL